MRKHADELAGPGRRAPEQGGGAPGEHYFSTHPRSASQPREWSVEVRGVRLVFETDRGVFSPARLDRGTRLLLEELEAPAGPACLLDLGCGYGPVGIFLARTHPEARVILTDVNRRAAALAARNLVRNGVTNAEVRVGDGFLPVQGLSFDGIYTNPPVRVGKEQLYGLLFQAAEYLRPGGWLWVVIRTRQGAASLLRALGERYTAVEERGRGGGYRILRASP